MDLMLLMAVFALYVMLPAWSAETAKIRDLPSRRVFFWLSVASIAAAAVTGRVIYHDFTKPAVYPELDLPAKLIAGLILFGNVMRVVESYGRFSPREQPGFDVLTLPGDAAAQSGELERHDSPEVK